MDFKKICVIGLGYIGLPTAATFAHHGRMVIGVDTNPAVIDTLRHGQAHIHEPGIQELVSESLASGRLCISTQPEPADAFIIAVPTPFTPDKTADLQFVKAASESIVPVLKPGNLVMLESTSPPRTTKDIVAPILEKSGLKAGTDFYLAYTPERVLPGKILHELIENARVVGGITPASAEAGRDLYLTFVKGKIVLSDATMAEMVKLMENTFRDVNIALANEFSRLADRYQVNIWQAIETANLHPRVNILQPGPGVGGHCISVDPWFLVEAAPDVAHLIKTARQVNDEQPQFMVNWLKRECGHSLNQKRIAVLGLAFKPNIDDLRESPAVQIAHQLMAEGALIKAYEPFLTPEKKTDIPTARSLEEAARDADIILILVAHDAFRHLNLEDLKRHTSAPVIADTVHVLSPEQANRAGFHLLHLGGG